MVLLEEFKDKVRPDIRSHLDEQKVEELEKTAIMADDYALTHKMSSKSGFTCSSSNGFFTCSISSILGSGRVCGHYVCDVPLPSHSLFGMSCSHGIHNVVAVDMLL